MAPFPIVDFVVWLTWSPPTYFLMAWEAASIVAEIERRVGPPRMPL